MGNTKQGVGSVISQYYEKHPQICTGECQYRPGYLEKSIAKRGRRKSSVLSLQSSKSAALQKSVFLLGDCKSEDHGQTPDRRIDYRRCHRQSKKTKRSTSTEKRVGGRRNVYWEKGFESKTQLGGFCGLPITIIFVPKLLKLMAFLLWSLTPPKKKDTWSIGLGIIYRPNSQKFFFSVEHQRDSGEGVGLVLLVLFVLMR